MSAKERLNNSFDRDSKGFYSRLLRISAPIAVQQLMLALVAVADALMLGSIEQNAMSAVTLATQVQFVQNLLISACAGPAAILGAQYWGKGERKPMLDVYNTALRMTAVISLAFFLACELGPQYLMCIFTNETALVEIGVRYLKVAGWSYLLVGTSQSLLSLMKVTEHVKTVAAISIGAVVTNIIFNAIFIYGWFGLPAMGAEGAALSTLMVRILELAACILMVMRKRYVKPNLKRILVYNRPLIQDFLRCMWPLLGAGMLWGIGFTSYTAFMGHLGEDAAAANSICSVVRDCVCCLTDGFATGAGIVVGNELGAGKLDCAKRYGIRIMRMSFVLGILSTGIMLLLVTPVAHGVKLTDGARDLLYGMMLVMAVYMIGRCVNTVVINGIFAAGGDTLFDMYSLAVAMWCLAVPLAALGTFVFHWHPVLVYAMTCLDEVGKIPWVLMHFRKYRWVRDLTR